MTTHRFPSLSARPDAAQYAERAENPAARVEMDDGRTVAQARYAYRPPVAYALVFPDMGDADKAALLGFWHQVRGEAEPFMWTRPTDGADVRVRFVAPDGLRFAWVEGRRRPDGAVEHRWSVTIDLEEDVP
jgi:hypothetical protein